MARPAARSAARLRGWAAAILAAAVGVLGVAAWLKPDPRGFGTHEQLGFGPCGWMLVTGYPCPTCGMTTAFAYTVRGDWLHAFLAQPAGFLLALATLGAGIVSGWMLVTGRWPVWIALLLTPFRIFLGLLVLLLGGWGVKLVLAVLSHSHR